MSRFGIPTLIVCGLALAGCGAGHRRPAARVTPARALAGAGAPATAGAHPPRRRRAGSGADPVPRLAVVTAETEDRLLTVALPSGRVVGSTPIPGSPEYVEAMPGGAPVIVVSPLTGTVTLLDRGDRPPVRAVLSGLAGPHIPALVPGGAFAYVTDDASGRLVAVDLDHRRIASSTPVGPGAHHLGISPDAHQVWVALGQAASTVVVLSTRVAPPPGVRGGFWSNPARPHLVARLHPGHRVHAVLFTPDGRQVWLTSASGSEISVYAADDRHRLRTIPAGPPPQHLVFAGPDAYVTSGYGASIERVSWRTGRVLRKVRAPYGSFELDAAGPWVITSSLLRGTVAIYDRRLRRLAVRRVAPAAEDVAILTGCIAQCAR